MTKTCPKCGKTKDLSGFYAHTSPCIPCKKIYNAQRKDLYVSDADREFRAKKIKSWRFRNPDKVKDRDRKRGTTWLGLVGLWRKASKVRKKTWDADLTVEYFKSLPFVCHYTGDDLTMSSHELNKVSIDRIDSKLGYTRDNVVLCRKDINIMKNRYSVEHFKKMCQKVITLDKSE